MNVFILKISVLILLFCFIDQTFVKFFLIVFYTLYYWALILYWLQLKIKLRLFLLYNQATQPRIQRVKDEQYTAGVHTIGKKKRKKKENSNRF